MHCLHQLYLMKPLSIQTGLRILILNIYLFSNSLGVLLVKLFTTTAFDCHFSRAVYKRILGKPQSLKDMETLDLEYFKSLMWMLENDITDVITEDFSVETDDYGEHKIIDLIPNGRNIPVTEENKTSTLRKLLNIDCKHLLKNKWRIFDWVP